jgi:hypothetical protein
MTTVCHAHLLIKKEKPMGYKPESELDSMSHWEQAQFFANHLPVGSHDATLASKVKEIIEKQWGKHLADIQYLSIRRFYERCLADEVVSYQPTNCYVLRAQFWYAREPRQAIFTLV